MRHVVLAGDSIFDNTKYAEPDFSVFDLFEVAVPADTRCSMIAVDGATIEGLDNQMNRLPKDTSHLFISCGQKDAEKIAILLNDSDESRFGGMIVEAAHEYTTLYHTVLQKATNLVKNVVICTVCYNSHGVNSFITTARALINEVILREAHDLGMPVMDLSAMLNEPTDFSKVSENEISEYGGRKIVLLMEDILKHHDFNGGHSIMYK